MSDFNNFLNEEGDGGSLLIEKANVSNVVEPGLMFWKKTSKCMSCSSVQRISSQVTDHEEQAQLSLMDKCSAWEAPCHKVDKGLRCSIVQLK